LQDFNPQESNESAPPPGSIFKQLNPVAFVIVVLVIIFFLYQFVGGLLALAAGDITMENPDVRITRIILSFGQFMFILAPAVFFARLRTQDLRSVFKLNAPKPSLLLLSRAWNCNDTAFPAGVYVFPGALN
jgi:hypothetical protein